MHMIEWGVAMGVINIVLFFLQYMESCLWESDNICTNGVGGGIYLTYYSEISLENVISAEILF